MPTAELGYRIRSQDVQRATQRLDAMTSSAGRAEREQRQLAATSTRTNSAMGRTAAATSRLGGSAQNTAFQVQDMATQIAAGTSATRALSLQLPQLLGGFGVMGAAAGAAVAVLGGLAGSFLSAGDASADMVDKLTSAEGGLSSVESATRELVDLQNTYTRAIAASGSTSSEAANVIAANSRREFNARRQVLAVEAELLRIRGQEQRSKLEGLQSEARSEAEAAATRNTGGIAGYEAGLPSDVAAVVNARPQTMEAYLGKDFLEANRKRRLAMGKLSAKIELTDLAADKARQALDSGFESVEGGGRVTVDDLPKLDGGSSSSGAVPAAVVAAAARLPMRRESVWRARPKRCSRARAPRPRNTVRSWAS